MEQYDYENVSFVDPDPARVLTKTKVTTPRKPLPEALTSALSASASAESPEESVKAVVVPGTQKAAKNLVTRMRTWANKVLDGKSVKADISAHGEAVQGTDEPDQWLVTFRVVPKRVVTRKAVDSTTEPADPSEAAPEVPESDDVSEETPAQRRRRNRTS